MTTHIKTNLKHLMIKLIPLICLIFISCQQNDEIEILETKLKELEGKIDKINSNIPSSYPIGKLYSENVINGTHWDITLETKFGVTTGVQDAVHFVFFRKDKGQMWTLCPRYHTMNQKARVYTTQNGLDIRDYEYMITTTIRHKSVDIEE